MAIEATPQDAFAEPYAMCPLKMCSDFRQRDVGSFVDQRENLLCIYLHTVGASVTAQRTSFDPSGALPVVHPPDCRGWRNPEKAGGGPPAHSVSYGFNDTDAQIV